MLLTVIGSLASSIMASVSTEVFKTGMGTALLSSLQRWKELNIWKEHFPLSGQTGHVLAALY